MTMTQQRRAETLHAAVSHLSKSLQRYYRVGLRALELEFHDKHGLRKLAKKYRINSDCLLKARRFVERLSDSASLALLCQKREKQGTPLSWVHVRHLVSVKDDARRFQLLQDAVGLSWSTVQLIETIQLCEGRTIRDDAGGRPPTKPASIKESLLRLQRLSEKWLALYESPAKSNSSALNDAERKLKHEVIDLFRSTKRATRKLKTQVAGLVEVLSCQAEELWKIVAVT